jgi:RNA polymerase sigma-70 factor, ECF subfamily
MVNISRDPWPTSDAELIEAMGRGDVSAFDELYGRYRDWVFRLAYRFTGNEHDAADVLQDTFAYFLDRTPQLQLHVKLTTFLYPAVKHLSLTLLRERGREIAADAVLQRALAAETDPPGSARKELATVLARLPAEQRETLLMRFVDGMTLEEIGEALGIPIGTVKSRVHNAIAALRADPRTRAYFEE